MSEIIKYPCEECGANKKEDFEFPCYSWDEWAVKCKRCGTEYG